jgi:hypothetical protein
MNEGGRTVEGVPPDTRPGALIRAGLRRGALLAFLPVLLAGQLAALIAYTAIGWDDPWGSVRVGLAVSLTSVRVAFDVVATASGDVRPAAGQLIVMTGALTIAVLVLSYRAGRAQGRGLEDTPVVAALAGSVVGVGFGVPAFIAALPVTLTLERFGIDRLEPVLWQAFVLPVVVSGCAGALGAVSLARDALSGRLGARVVAACRGGALAFWWGAVLGFIALLVIAALLPKQVGEYARALERASTAGPIVLAGQTLLLPNAAVMVLGTSMGATTTLTVGTYGAVTLTRAGIDANGAAGGSVLALLGVDRPDIVRFPWWFAGLAAVPSAATIIGGRTAAADADGIAQRALRGASAGVIYALLCALGVWAASITVPAWWIGDETVSLGATPAPMAALALAWGVVGGAIGGAIRWPARLSADPA